MAMTREDNARGGQLAHQTWKRRTLESAQRAAVLDTVLNYTEREQIGPELLEHAIELIRQAANNEIEPHTASDVRHLAEAGKIIHGMARLEFGESTANVAHASIQDRQAQAEELQARLDALKACEQDSPGA